MIALKPFQTIGAAFAGLLIVAAASSQRVGSEVQEFLKTRDRWAVKTGADTGAKYIRVGVIQPTKVKKLIPLDRPGELPLKSPGAASTQINRLSDAESKVFSIDADILRYCVDPVDRDIYMVIRDHDDTTAEDPAADSGERRTMIAKIPDPSLVSSGSPWLAAIASVRREFEQKYRPSAAFTERVIHVKIAGIGYFDYLHGQNGFAVNGLELHPVLSLEFVGEPGPVTETVMPHRTKTIPSGTKPDVTPDSAPDKIGIPLKPIGESDGQKPAHDVAAPAERITPPDNGKHTVSSPAIKPHKSVSGSPAVDGAGVKNLPKSGRATHPTGPAAVGAHKVWVDLATGTFYRPGAAHYRKSKRGREMDEAEAIKIGFIPGTMR